MTADPRAALKQVAADAAVALVEEGMVVGLGSGSTASLAIASLARLVGDGLNVLGIPTSENSAALARAGGIILTDFASHPRIDLTIDGADEIDPVTLNLIKGLGGALLREKIVAAASARLVIVADTAKLVHRLGVATPVPVEVVPFGWEATAVHIRALGAEPVRRMAGGVPFITDGGNIILDCKFPGIEDPAATDFALRDIVGVVETGLFIHRANLALVAGTDGVTRIAV